MFAAADIAAVEWIRRIIAFINSDKTDFSIYLVLALIFIALGRGIGFFIGNYFMSRVGFGIVHDLRSELFAKLINLPKMYFDQNQSGQLTGLPLQQLKFLEPPQMQSKPLFAKASY
jgi:ABC-type multidrug transport system fused ATPase/permease subunit